MVTARRNSVLRIGRAFHCVADEGFSAGVLSISATIAGCIQPYKLAEALVQQHFERDPLIRDTFLCSHGQDCAGRLSAVSVSTC